MHDDQLLKNLIIEYALKFDPELIKNLLSNDRLKRHFFFNMGEVMFFDRDKFLMFVDNKEFLPDSFTAFKNRVGLTIAGNYLKEIHDVVLSFPFKDCILEGDQNEYLEERNEIYWNEILAPESIDRLLDPKALTSFKKFDSDGEHEIDGIAKNDNLVIRGNNLLVLHTLKERFPCGIKLIFIDPPYNIGGDGFNYNDRFKHSTWLLFMKNRLEIAKELLSKKGAIFIQIDYHELAYINVLCDEIFGRENFVQLISVKTSSPAGVKTFNPGPIEVTEYILFYAKDRKSYEFKKMYVPVDYDENYDQVIVNPLDEANLWKLRPLSDVVYEVNGIKLGKTRHESNKNAKELWGNQWKIIRKNAMADYALKHASIVVSIRDPQRPAEELKKLLIKSKTEPDKVFMYVKSDEESKGYVINGGALSFYSNKLKTIDGVLTPTELLSDLWTDISWDGIAKEGSVTLKNGKKPEKLIRRIIEYVTEPNEIVLDFYSGSGTTAAVSHKLGRQYIAVEQINYNENDTIQRLKNVINGENSGISKVVDWKGGGSFVYAELMKLNQIYVDSIRAVSTEEEIISIWRKLVESPYLSYRVNKDFNLDSLGFRELSTDEQKKFLLEVLDKNQLYVNYSEIDDADFSVSEKEKELNHSFYVRVTDCKN
jgi:adenine-specific DNA-methyltransferase